MDASAFAAGRRWDAFHGTVPRCGSFGSEGNLAVPAAVGGGHARGNKSASAVLRSGGERRASAHEERHPSGKAEPGRTIGKADRRRE